MKLICIHRGTHDGSVESGETMRGRPVKIKAYKCAVHERCTDFSRPVADGVANCANCQQRRFK